VGDRFDLEGFGRVAERSCRQAGSGSKVWMTLWLSAILVTTVVMAISHAPGGAYEILLVVAVVVGSADGRPERR
jgi:hypothetical protein